MSVREALGATARSVALAEPAAAHGWGLLVQAIDVGWLDDGDLIELQSHLRDRRDFGVEELLFAHLGDRLRVSFLDDDVECDPADLLAAVSELLDRRARPT